MCFGKVRRRFQGNSWSAHYQIGYSRRCCLYLFFFCEAQAELWNYNNKYFNFWIIKININKQDDSSQVVLDIPHFHDWFLEVETPRNMTYISIKLLVAYIPSGYLRFQGWYNFHTKNPREQLGIPESFEEHNWVVVSFTCFIFTPKLGKWSNLRSNNFQMGWNHQLDKRRGCVHWYLDLCGPDSCNRIRCSVPKNCSVSMFMFDFVPTWISSNGKFKNYPYIQVWSDVYIYIEYMDRHMQSRHKKSEFHLELDSVPCLDPCFI